MQFAVQVNVFQDFGAIGLKGGTKIAEVDAGGFRHHPVGDARRDFTGDCVVYSFFAPAAGDVIAFVDFGEERGDVFGGVLKVTIHGNDDVAGCFVKARGEGGGLAEVAAQADDFQTGVSFDEIGEEFGGAVAGGVVYKDDFVGLILADEDRGEAIVKGKDGVFFVMYGDDYRQHGGRPIVAVLVNS